MDLQQVRYCLAIAEARSFGRAAKRCGVRQPSVSNGVKRLESQLGGKLFLRSRPVQLSKLGAALLPIFAQIDKLAEKAQNIASGHSRCRPRGASTLRVATRGPGAGEQGRRIV
jgi:DNA-binding transcriptional LysR family regulator